MTERKIGQRKTDLSGESTAEVLKKAKTLIRTDFGGSPDPESVIKKKLLAVGIEAGPKSCAAIKKLLEEQVDSCRKRAFPRIDEAIRRVSGTAVEEVIP